ncbi:MAG: fused MFS/spermidine synthase [Spirochaetia bacterium]|nr:fused MFS/spermidine synthase [Spirochaetia bacterium]
MNKEDCMDPEHEVRGHEVRERHNAHSGMFYDRGHTIVEARTQYQHAELIETEALGRVLLLDGITQVSECWEERYHQSLVHPAMLAHPNPRRVLVLGGGDGGTLREIVRHRSVELVDFVELDPDVVKFCRDHLYHVHRGSFGDPRVRFHYGDGRTFMESPAISYDVIIMDMTDPDGPARFLYTAEFFSAVRAALRDERSVFAMHGESPAARPAAFACIGTTLRSVFPVVSTATAFVPMYGTLWSFRYASASTDPSGLATADLERRMAGRMDSPPSYTSVAMWQALFAPDPIIAAAELHPDARVIRDAEPDFPDAFEL